MKSSSPDVPHGDRLAPLRQLGMTLAALGELGALLDPFRAPATPALERPAPSAPGPGAEGDGRKTRPSPRDHHPDQRAVPAAEQRAGKTAEPLSRDLLQSLRRPANIAFAVVVVAVVSVWWVALRPTAFLGGPATFITVKGTSMLPTLKTGDFVLAEAQSGYEIGDLVVYRVPKGQIGAGDDLIHRIVAGNATTGFTLKGDNNPAPDPWTVPRSDVLGKEALVVPGLGNSLLVIRSPLFAGLVAALIAVWLVISPPQWRRRRKPAVTEATPPAGSVGIGRSPGDLAPVEEPALDAVAPAAVLDAVAPAATRPPTRRPPRAPAKPAAPGSRPHTAPARPRVRVRPPRQEP
ncbi:MAG: signal peptidase I [Candidatus Dormibacteria bacterium]